MHFLSQKILKAQSIINKKFKKNFEYKKYIVVSLHPETISNISYHKQINLFFKSIKKVKLDLIFTSPSPDDG